MTSTADAPKTGATESGRVKGSREGVVMSDRNDKTRKVLVQFQAMHPKYGKYLNKRTSVQVHDENNESREGDRVEIAPCRRMSKTKSWKLVRVVNRAPEA